VNNQRGYFNLNNQQCSTAEHSPRTKNFNLNNQQRYFPPKKITVMPAEPKPRTTTPSLIPFPGMQSFFGTELLFSRFRISAGLFFET
jgi:hypothetical protein